MHCARHLSSPTAHSCLLLRLQKGWSNRFVFPPVELRQLQLPAGIHLAGKGAGRGAHTPEEQLKRDTACVPMSHIELIDFVAMMHCSARPVLPFTGSLAVPAQPCHFSVSHRTCRELYRLRASSARLEATTARERVRQAQLQHSHCAHMVCLCITMLCRCSACSMLGMIITIRAI